MDKKDIAYNIKFWSIPIHISMHNSLSHVNYQFIIFKMKVPYKYRVSIKHTKNKLSRNKGKIKSNLYTFFTAKFNPILIICVLQQYIKNMFVFNTIKQFSMLPTTAELWPCARHKMRLLWTETPQQAGARVKFKSMTDRPWIFKMGKNTIERLLYRGAPCRELSFRKLNFDILQKLLKLHRAKRRGWFPTCPGLKSAHLYLPTALRVARWRSGQESWEAR